MRHLCFHAEAELGHQLPKLVRDGAGTGDDVEQDVPLRPQDHEQGPVVQGDPQVDEDDVANGNSRMAGKLARTWTTGWAYRDRLGLIPILTPIGTHKRVDTATTTTTRTKVKKPRPKQWANWPKPEVLSK